MSVTRENVARLVRAAWTGMSAELAHQPASAEDVINAAINVARNAINFACNDVEPALREANRLVIRTTLQQLLLDTVDNKTDKVM